ncbi:hypothetical protein, partial [Marinobacter vinifirmus]|uniref:hypothetical protein n=1 Tax=Marinobacter vinifirmus TaxID=355591 RepID=UPI00235600FC
SRAGRFDGEIRQPAKVAALPWNQWQLSRGMGGRLRLESVATLVWNTQIPACADKALGSSLGFWRQNYATAVDARYGHLEEEVTNRSEG